MAQPFISKCITRLREWGISMVRTAVAPQLAGWVLVQAARLGITIDSTKVQIVAQVVAAAAWYGIMRGVELIATNPRIVKIAGWLLLSTKSPAARVVGTIADPALIGVDRAPPRAA